MVSFVGFYWTFPVRWAGFLDLPRDAARAAQASRTVAYQRALVRQHVDLEKGVLASELVAMEVSPDRGTSAIDGDVARAGRLCREAGATLLYVDFQQNGGWRPHPLLSEAVVKLEHAGVSVTGLPAEELMLDGWNFAPAMHFSKWRDQEKKERERRRQVVPKALGAALAEVPEGRGRWAKIAALLNERGSPTSTGGAVWNAENVRKAAKKIATT